jgi:hypothetical protein
MTVAALRITCRVRNERLVEVLADLVSAGRVNRAAGGGYAISSLELSFPHSQTRIPVTPYDARERERERPSGSVLSAQRDHAHPQATRRPPHQR